MITCKAHSDQPGQYSPHVHSTVKLLHAKGQRLVTRCHAATYLRSLRHHHHQFLYRSQSTFQRLLLLMHLSYFPLVLCVQTGGNSAVCDSSQIRNARNFTPSSILKKMKHLTSLSLHRCSLIGHDKRVCAVHDTVVYQHLLQGTLTV